MTQATQGVAFSDQSQLMLEHPSLNPGWSWVGVVAVAPVCCIPHDSLLPVLFQAYIKIYQGEELPHPKSMLQVGVEWEFLHWNCHEFPGIGRGVQHSGSAVTLFQMPQCSHPRSLPWLRNHTWDGLWGIAGCTQHQPAQLE